MLFGIAVAALGVGMLSYAQVQAAPQILANTMSDVPSISEAQTRADHIKYYYLPTAAFYSAAEGAYDEGQYDDLNYQNIDSQNKINNHYNTTIEEANTTANDYFSNYTDELENYQMGSNCELVSSDKALDMDVTSTNVKVLNADSSENFIEVECVGSEGTTTVRNIQSEEEEIEEDLKNLRFEQLLIFMRVGLNKLNDNKGNVDDENSPISGSSMCVDSKTTAENNAESDARSNAQSQVNSEISSVSQTAENEITSRNDIETSDTNGILSFAVELVEETFGWDQDYGLNLWEASGTNYDISIQNTNPSKCGCEDGWDCPNDWSTNSGENDYPGGECSYTGTTPSPGCPTDYSIDPGTCTCENNTDSSDTTSASCSTTNGYDFTCNSGSCEVASSDIEDETCGSGQNSDYKWDATSESEYDIHTIEWGIELFDNKYKLPIGQSNDWKNLSIDRRFIANY